MKRLIFLGLIVLLAVLIATFPARVAYRMFSPPEIQLSGISGSVWNGAATEAFAGGAYLRDIAWQLEPSSILSGKLAFATRSSPMSGQVEARVAISPDGTLTLSAVTGHVPLDLVHPALHSNGVLGTVEIDFASLVVQAGVPVAATGTVTISDLFVRNLAPARIGDFRADFATADDGINASVSDVDGILDLDGRLSIQNSRTFTFIGEVSPMANAPSALVDQLRYLGSRNARGMHEFRFEGSF